MLTANAAINHVIGFTVCGKYPLCENNSMSDGTLDDVIWTWFYDHLGIIGGEGINFVQDLPRFMVLLYALQRFRMKEWGRMPEFTVHESGKTTEAVIFKLQLDAGQQRVVLPAGRGTDVRDVTLEDPVSVSTAILRKGLGVNSANVGGRTHYRLVVCRELRPLDEIDGPEARSVWLRSICSTSAMSGRHRRVLKPAFSQFTAKRGRRVSIIEISAQQT